MRISFVIPVHNREATIDRCLKSVFQDGQTDKNRFTYEAVVVNDASTDGTKDKIDKWKKKYPYQVTAPNFQDRLERIYGFNAGMMKAQGDWIIHLDSDDEMLPEFKHTFESYLERYPTANIFNWDGEVVWKDGRVTKRGLFEPELQPSGQCEIFKSGGIYSGGFAFRRNMLNVTGYLPFPRKEEATSPYAFGRVFLNHFDELKPLYTMEDGHLKTDLGNPWGQDFAMFYMLTRHAMPVGIDKVLHRTYVRP